MPANFYIDNPDLRFHLRHRDIEDIVRLRERDYAEAAESALAPDSYEDALDAYDQTLAMVGELCGERIAPRAEAVDQAGARLEKGQVYYAPGTEKNMQELAAAGLMGATLPRCYGGLNLPNMVYTMMNEMVSRADASLQNLFGLQDIGETINRFGSDEQKQHYLPLFAGGQADGAMALTEPEAGSDLQAVQLKARFDPTTNQWYLNGMKRFITNGCARLLLVLARSEEGSRDGRGLSMFICERGPQLLVRRLEDKLGIHGSPTCELQFNDVPAELVGQRRRGLSRYVMSLMNGARVAIGSQAVGIAEAAHREAVKYAREREQFGKSIDAFPPVYEMLVNGKVRTMAARALLYETCRHVDLRDAYEELVEHGVKDPEIRRKSKEYSRLAAVLTPLAKAYSTEVANQVAYDSLQVHGGTGYMRDFAVERLCRDARITNIYEGTTQLQVVAAIGGVMRRMLEPMYDQLAQCPYHSKLRRLASRVDVARDRLNRAVQYVESRHDSEFHDLVARRLCYMETMVLVGYLMLRDAHLDPSREPVAERFVLDWVPSVSLDYEYITSGDLTLIDGHEKVLNL